MLFKIGDRVRCVKAYTGWTRQGEIYTVTDTFTILTSQAVELDAWPERAFPGWWFEPAE